MRQYTDTDENILLKTKTDSEELSKGLSIKNTLLINHRGLQYLSAIYQHLPAVYYNLHVTTITGVEI